MVVSTVASVIRSGDDAGDSLQGYLLQQYGTLTSLQGSPWPNSFVQMVSSGADVVIEVVVVGVVVVLVVEVVVEVDLPNNLNIASLTFFMMLDINDTNRLMIEPIEILFALKFPDSLTG